MALFLENRDQKAQTMAYLVDYKLSRQLQTLKKVVKKVVTTFTAVTTVTIQQSL